MRHPRGMLDEALDAAGALRERPDLRAPAHLHGLLLGSAEEGDHAAEVAHLAGGNLVAGMARESREDHALDGRVGVEERSHPVCVLAVLTHAYGERLQA